MVSAELQVIQDLHQYNTNKTKQKILKKTGFSGQILLNKSLSDLTKGSLFPSLNK